MTPELQVTFRGPTFQGSGHLLGVRQFFVRFAGCSVKSCPIRRDCDEQFALKKENGSRVSVRQVIDEALEEVGVGGWLHVTGGEPTDQYAGLEALLQEAQNERLKVHVQSSGTRALEMPFDWLTVSPKVPARKLEQTFGHELLLVWDGHKPEEMREYMEATRFWYYYLQPKWSGERATGGAVSQEELVQTAHEVSRQQISASEGARHHNAGEWLLTIQAHKYWGNAWMP